MKKWIAAILTLVMLTQALPWTAFADAIAAGQMITDKELQQALQIAGMRVTTGAYSSEKTVTSKNALMAAASNDSATIRVEANDSGYHSGMTPDETWDAQMLMDWLDDKLSRDIYNVTNIYARAETILERLKDSDPSAYARYTQNADFVDTCHKWAIDAEYAEEQARLLHQRLGENTVVIENNTEMLANGADSLFDYEKARYSEQIREATEALEALRDDVLTFSIEQVLIIITGQAMIDGTVEPEFSAWLKEVLSSEDDAAEATVSSDTVMSAALNTRVSRMAAAERVLAAPNSQDVSVRVISENEFAVIIRGVGNQLVGGVRVTVKDLNGTAVKTMTTDSKYGSAVFNANDFVCDYDKEMEISLEVDASAQGYRSFYIPWTIMKRGGKRTETLTLLTGPETKANYEAKSVEEKANQALFAAKAADAKPYIYSCAFNGYDIVHQDKKTIISSANDAQVTFAVEVDHASGASPKAPVLHCYVNDTSELIAQTVEKTFYPTSTEKVSATRTRYIYKSTWKRDLAPEITVDEDNPSKDQRPWFVLPDTGETVKTKLVPVRSKVDKPVITGQEASNPLNSVLENGFGFNLTIPEIGGKLSLSLPFDQYLPKVAFDPTGYITVTFGSSLVKNPKDLTLWKSEEAEKYDKAMKDYQHATSLTSKKQALNTAKDYYRPILSGNPGMTRVKMNFGYFVMFSGRGEMDEVDGSTLWSLSGSAGGEFTFSADYTQTMTIGPVPVYMNINFTASAGVALEGLYFSFRFDHNFKLQGFDWSLLRGITINVRLALTVSLGVGIKGICSLWVSATGALNIIISLMQKQPTHIAVYLEVSVSVGFEIFWIKYSRVIWQLDPKVIIYSNYDLNAQAAPFSLFTAYAEEATADDAPLTPLEPERYPQLAPKAKAVMTSAENVKAGIKVLEYQGRTLLFYIGNGKDEYGDTRRCVCWMDMASGKQEILPYPFSAVGRGMSDYDFDVATDRNTFAITACCADQFDGNGLPVPGRVKSYSIIFGPDYGDMVPDSDYFSYVIKVNKLDARSWGYDSLSNPRIDELSTRFLGGDGSGLTYTINGAFDAAFSGTGERGIIGFEASTEGTMYQDTLFPLPDITIKSAFSDANERVEVFTDGKSGGDYSDKILPINFPCVGFVALSKPKDGAAGDSGIELYDFAMNIASATTRIDGSTGRRVASSTNRKAIELTRGDIDHIEVVKTLQPDGKKYSRTIFYTQTETAGERQVNRLKGIYIGPKAGNDNSVKFDVSYNDYDLSLPSTDFRSVTFGATQYLYWLSTVSKEKESDPDIWRITGVYYDASTNTMSDQIVIAEFTLPNSQWKGKSWRSVPFDITLMDSGTGYITAKPDTSDENDRAIAPMTLYSFPISFKTVANLKGASLMETTVCQGEMVATDLTVMNEGNMGIGSFDVELWLMENGKEKQKIETLHADCMHPANSTLVMHTGGRDETVAKGEAAFYRLKDFIYSPRQSEWLVKTENKTVTIKDGTNVSTTAGSGSSNRVTTNVLVPGALGGFTGSIKIPSDWQGEKKLRLKLTKESTYSNWLAAAALAKSNPELFAEASVQSKGLFAASDASSNAQALAALGIVKLDYALDEDSDKLVLQNPETLYAAKGNGGAALFAAGENSGDDESLRLYATEIEAPEPVDINCDVHDIDVSHRLYDDYYGDERLEITISNYHNDDTSVRLTCAMYLDDSETPEYISLPYDPTMMAAGKTTTIDVPLSTLFDPTTVRTARFVFSAPGIAETADVNNEFTIYPGGTPELSFTQDIQAEIDRDGEVVAYTGTIPAREGETVTLHVDVTGGAKPYHYQWQVYDPATGKWVDLKDGGTISGANSDTLTLQNVKGEWDGRQARCVVTDSSGTTITSDPITLRVAASGEPTAPDTGDHANLPLYLAIAVLALAALIMIRRRRQGKQN